MYVTPPTSIKFDEGKLSRLEAITDRLNDILDRFRKTSHTHLWMIDADIEVPPHALCTLLKLDVDVASGVYSFHNFPPNMRSAMMFGRMPKGEDNGMIPRSVELGFKGDGVIGKDFRVGGGNGCLLLKRRVLDSGIRFANKYKGFGSDLNFWYTVQEMGFSARVHGGVLCGHLPNNPLKSYSEKE